MKKLFIIMVLGCINLMGLASDLKGINNFSQFITQVPWEQMVKDNDVSKMKEYFSCDFCKSFTGNYSQFRLLECKLSSDKKNIEYEVRTNTSNEKIKIPVMKHEVFPYIRICWFKALIEPYAKSNDSKKCIEAIKQLTVFLSIFASFENKDIFISVLAIRKLSGMQNELKQFLIRHPKLFSKNQIKDMKSNNFLTMKFQNKYKLKISSIAIKLQHKASDSLNTVLENYPTSALTP